MSTLVQAERRVARKIAAEAGDRLRSGNREADYIPELRRGAAVPVFAVSLGLVYRNESIVGVVYDPVREELFSAWQRFDNKGRAVEKWQPFFASGWEPDLGDRAHGRKSTYEYDARGRLVRTINADGTEYRVVHGVRSSLLFL